MNDPSKLVPHSQKYNLSQNIYNYEGVIGDRVQPNVATPFQNPYYPRQQLHLQQFQYQFQYPQFHNHYPQHNFSSQQVPIASPVYCPPLNTSHVSNISAPYPLLGNNVYGVVPQHYYVDTLQDRSLNVPYTSNDDNVNANYYQVSPYIGWHQGTSVLPVSNPSFSYNRDTSNAKLAQNYLDPTKLRLLYDKPVHPHANFNKLDPNPESIYYKKLKNSNLAHSTHTSSKNSYISDTSHCHYLSQPLNLIQLNESQTSLIHSEKPITIKRRKTIDVANTSTKQFTFNENAQKKRASLQEQKELKKKKGEIPGSEESKKKISKKTKEFIKEHKFNISLPPPPKDIMDDNDIGVTDLKYYRAPLPFDEGIQHYKCPSILEIVDYIETISDWLFLPHNKHHASSSNIKIFPSVMERLLGLTSQENHVFLHLDILMASLLRLFCRRFERLRSSEIATLLFLSHYQIKRLSDYLILKDNPQKIQSSDFSYNYLNEIMIETFHSKHTNTKNTQNTENVSYYKLNDYSSSAHKNSTKRNWISDINGSFPSVLSITDDFYHYPYNSWFPLSVTSKQPPQILTRYGWQNASSNYAPLDAILTQPTIRLLYILENELQDHSSHILIKSPVPNDISQSSFHDALYPGKPHYLWTYDLLSLNKLLTSTLKLANSSDTSHDLTNHFSKVQSHLVHYRNFHTNCVLLYYNRSTLKCESQQEKVLLQNNLLDTMNLSDSEELMYSSTTEENDSLLNPVNIAFNLESIPNRDDTKYLDYRIKFPRISTLKFGLILAVPWWKDEGSINNITWELYLRFVLWECLCDIRPETLKYGRLFTESKKKKKKKKIL